MTAWSDASADQEGMRERLQHRREDGQQELARLSGSNPRQALDVVAVARRSSLRHELSEIDAALQRIDDGTFGQCTRCKAEIDDARLDQMPHASLCGRCHRRSMGGAER